MCRFREQQQRQQEREEKLRLLASGAELKALRAQINPHFLFNALNAIAGLIPSQPELADQTIEGLAQVFRYTLRRSESEWVRLDEEVEFVAAYLRVEQARFGARLTIHLLVEPDAGRLVQVPAMYIQPLVENALRHGVSCFEEQPRNQTTMRSQWRCADHRGFRQRSWVPTRFHGFAASSGHALRNIAERLKGYYGEMGKLIWGRYGEFD